MPVPGWEGAEDGIDVLLGCALEAPAASGTKAGPSALGGETVVGNLFVAAEAPCISEGLQDCLGDCSAVSAVCSGPQPRPTPAPGGTGWLVQFLPMWFPSQNQQTWANLQFGRVQVPREKL